MQSLFKKSFKNAKDCYVDKHDNKGSKTHQKSKNYQDPNSSTFADHSKSAYNKHLYNTSTMILNNDKKKTSNLPLITRINTSDDVMNNDSFRV